MTIKTTLRIAFLGIGIGFLAFALVVIERMGSLRELSDQMRSNYIPSMVYTGSITDALDRYRIDKALHILTTDDAEMARLEAAMTAIETKIADWRRKYEPLINSDDELATYKLFSEHYQQYLDSSRKTMALSRKNENKEAADRFKGDQAIIDLLTADMAKLVETNVNDAYQAVDDGDALFAKGRRRILVLAGLVLLGAGLLAWTLERTISRPLGALAAAVDRVGAGDLGGEVPGRERRDEIGIIGRSVAGTQDTLRTVVEQLNGLIGEARNGNLAAHAQSSALKGEYVTLVTGANDLIDALSRPLVEVAKVMQRLAAGDVDGRIEGAYEGDLRALKSNVNRSLEALVALLGEIGAVAGALAAGNLARPLEGSFQGGFAGLKANVNQGLDQLRELVGAVAGDTQQVSVAITQTSAAARQVAEGSGNQLVTLTDLAETIGQTADAVQEVAAQADLGRQLTAQTASLAADGRQELTRLVGEVEQIAARHGVIDRITTTITRIADKTHVLSINAGIEAARAGDDGRSFAVVADQIGKLAEEAAAAARDIGTLIGEATGGVQRAVGGVGAARGTMERIADAATRSGDTTGAIAAAITEQSSAVQLLSQRVDDLRESGQGNAAAAEEISATMEDLARIIHRTRSQMARFVLS